MADDQDQGSASQNPPQTDWLGPALARVGSIPTGSSPDNLPTIEPQPLVPIADITQMYKQMANLPHAISQAWQDGIMPSADREQVYLENERSQNLARYRQDPEGLLEEARSYVIDEPQDGPNRLAKEQYMQRLPLEVIDKIYRSQLQSEVQNETKPFKTHVETNRAYGGAILRKTYGLLAALKKRA